MAPNKRQRVALLLGENDSNNSLLTAGIVGHMRHQMLDWNVLMSSAARDPAAVGALVACAEAFIVSTDHYQSEALQCLQEQGAAVIGIGLASSPCAPEHRAPTVFADNAALAQSAYGYLTSHGACHFALFGAPADPHKRWVQEREQAFIEHGRRDGASVNVFRCEQIGYPLFNDGMNALAAWLEELPKPVAIFAADEVRARMLSQACALAGYDMNSQIEIVGVDCDALAQDLSPVPLASVMLDYREMGRRAAHMLERALARESNGPGVRDEWVAPLDLVKPPHNASAPLHDEYVMRALHYIRLNAKRGIKAEQVAYYVRMSRSSLELRFRRDLGRTVHDEILRFKLEEAKQMLRSGATSIPTVALSCGFTSVQYLYTVFGRELGCTPRAWRERVLKQVPLAQAA